KAAESNVFVASPLKTSPGQPHAHSSTAYRPAECGPIASRTARSRDATSEFTPRDQPSHRVPRRSALDRHPHPAPELDHRCRHGTRSRPECVSNRSGEHAGQPCSRQGRSLGLRESSEQPPEPDRVPRRSTREPPTALLESPYLGPTRRSIRVEQAGRLVDGTAREGRLVR